MRGAHPIHRGKYPSREKLRPIAQIQTGRARIRNPDTGDRARLLSPEPLEYKTQSLKEVGLVDGANPNLKTKPKARIGWIPNQQGKKN